ncbi:MAG: hypothetical protein OXQ94_03680 [Gemmatimonadota bacterium]|nr:hypothetical protein [Gemmatimonadota bacterium]MDE2870778.1 hypothetical protein [Gemmatimonadota bacterium]
MFAGLFHGLLVHEGGTRLELDRDGKAAFFTPEVTRHHPRPPNRLSSGAPRFVDSAVPLSL